MDSEDTADIKNDSSKSGDSFKLKILEKGIGYLIDKDYLKDDKLLLPPIFQHQHIKTNFGNASQASDSVIHQSLNETIDRLKSENDKLDKDLKAARLSLVNLQIKETKNKKIYAVIGGLLSAGLTLLIDHGKNILKF